MEDPDNVPCSVNGCRNRQTESKYAFFGLPSEFRRRVEWLRVIGRPDLLNRMTAAESSYKVCTRHFEKTAISELIIRKLQPFAVPTRYLPLDTDLDYIRYRAQEGLADASTQTCDSYGIEQPEPAALEEEKDVYVEVNGRTILLKKEKDPISTVYPEMNFFSARTPVKPQSNTEMAGPQMKKRKKK